MNVAQSWFDHRGSRTQRITADLKTRLVDRERKTARQVLRHDDAPQHHGGTDRDHYLFPWHGRDNHSGLR